MHRSTRSGVFQMLYHSRVPGDGHRYPPEPRAIHMDAHRILAICFLVTVGCEPTGNDGNKSAVNSAQTPVAAGSQAMPARITNQFGMTFCLVEIDTSRADHKDSFPKASFYLQETELTWEQHRAFRKAAFGDGTYETINWNYNSGYPSEWRDVFRYGEALSKFDTQYDYRLPRRQNGHLLA